MRCLSYNVDTEEKIRHERLSREFFVVRRMTKTDIPEVLEIERLSFPNPWRQSVFEGEVDNAPISHPIVVIHSRLKKIIGYIIYWQIKEEIQISNICIHPDFRRLGIGEMILKDLIAGAKENGGEYIILEVRPSNTTAKKLYEKLGFQNVGIRHDYYMNPQEDADILALKLS
ncbi:ribosomal protein S18-alanine N-acetyltransferase [Acidobacteriota bacterium]